MRSFEATILVAAEGKATLQLPADFAPGPHRVMLTPVEEPPTRTPGRKLNLPVHDIPWPFAADETFRREDMYDDEGRCVGIDIHRLKRADPGDGGSGTPS